MTKALHTIKKIKLIYRKEFTTLKLDKKKEVFVMYIIILLTTPVMLIYSL